MAILPSVGEKKRRNVDAACPEDVLSLRHADRNLRLDSCHSCRDHVSILANGGWCSFEQTDDD